MNRSAVNALFSLFTLVAATTLVGCPGGTTENTDGSPNTNSNDDTANPDDDDDGDGTVPAGGSSTIEPDDFADGTVLTDTDPRITLSTALDDNEIAELFEITATLDADNAATGEHVFGHSEIPFFNDARRLRIDFKGSGSAVSIIFTNGENFGTEIGRLEAFDEDGDLLAQYVTEALQPGQSEEMSVAVGNIAFAIAYIADGEGSFGRLDELKFTASGVGGTATLSAP